MSARYLIRLDDASATMNRHKWELIERVLNQHAIKPIVAVVPDNQDAKLMFEARDPAFWDKVRDWAAQGWTVAMHGYRHVMHPTDAKLMLPYYRRSEFAGLSLAEQAAKIRSAWQLFLAEGVVPQVWVAPAHSFDLLTLEAVRAETSIRVVSDGIAWKSFREQGFHWIPQQLWGLAERKWGLWTVCLHPNQMTEEAIAAFGRTVGDSFQGRISDFKDIRLRSSSKSFAERVYQEYFWWRWRRAVHAAQ
jgi:predicted deacetylase